MSDGGNAISDTATIDIAAVNDTPTGAPTATLVNGTEDVTYAVNASDLLADFTDLDGDTLPAANLASSSGSVTNNGDRTYTISAPANANGLVALTQDVTDGSGGSLAGQERPKLCKGDQRRRVFRGTRPFQSRNDTCCGAPRPLVDVRRARGMRPTD